MDLRTIRFIANLTQVEFADIAGLWQPRLSILERGLAKPSKTERERIDEFIKHSNIDTAFVDYISKKRGIENAKNSY